MTTVAANTAELVNFQKPSVVKFPFKLRPTLDASWTTWNNDKNAQIQCHILWTYQILIAVFRQGSKQHCYVILVCIGFLAQYSTAWNRENSVRQCETCGLVIISVAVMLQNNPISNRLMTISIALFQTQAGSELKYYVLIPWCSGSKTVLCDP